MKYCNLDLDIFDAQGSGDIKKFKVRVLSSPAGEQKYDEAVEVGVQPGLRKRLGRLERRRLRLQEMINLGVELGGYLFPARVRRYLDESLAELDDDEGLRVRLRLETFALANLPWEYAYVSRSGTELKSRDGFLVLNREISLVRYEVQGKRPGQLGPIGPGPIRFVMLMASPKDYPELRLDVEKEKIEKVLDELQHIRCEFYSDATLETLEDALVHETHIFHFAGHGEFRCDLGEHYGSVDGSGSIVLLGDRGSGTRLFSAEKLAIYLKGRGVRLAVLGACHTGRRGEVNPWTGVVPALTQQGIPAVLGMQYSIYDDNAASFSRSFYQALAGGQPIDAAVHDGRLAILNRCEPDDRDWGVPVLYLHHRTGPNEGVIFPTTPIVESGRRAIVSYPSRLVPESHDVAAILRREGQAALDRGDYEHAESFFRQSLSISEGLDDKPGVASTLNQLGILAQEQEKYTKAKEFYERALDIRRANSGEDSLDVAQSLNILAALHQAMDNYPTAAQFWQKAVEVYRSAVGENHPDFATSLNNLAGWYHAMGLYDDARKLYQQALEIWRSKLGDDHPYVAQSLNNLALLYKAVGNYAAAEQFYQQALDIQRSTLEQNHPDLAQTLSNLASLYEATGRQSQAGELYQQVIGIRRATLGDYHPDTAQSFCDLASLYETLGNYVEAESLYVQALEVYREKLGADHSHVVRILRNLALLYESVGDYKESEGHHDESRVATEKAEQCYLQVLDIYRTTLGERHPDFVSTLNSLAELYRTVGNHIEAERLYQQVLEIYRATGEKDEYIAQCLHNLGTIARAEADYAEALQFFQESCDIKTGLGDRPGVAGALYQLGQTVQEQGYDKSRGFYQQSLEISEELGDRASIARNLYQLGIIAQTQGNCAEARHFFQQSLESSRELGRWTYIADNLERLALLAYQRGDHDEAGRLSQESISVRVETAWVVHLTGILMGYSDEGQVRAIALELGIDYDDLPGKEYGSKTRDLVATARKLNQLGRLSQIIKERRPDVSL